MASSSAHGADVVHELFQERVIFKSGSLTLVGFVFKPDGPGPFPALVWNHGSEQSPGTMRQFDAVAAIFVPAGYVVFAPMRRGHGDSEGPYIMDQLRRTDGGRSSLLVRVMEGEQLDEAEIALLETFADQAAVAINNAQNQEALAKQAERLRILHEIDRGLIAEQSLDAIAAAALRPCASRIPEAERENQPLPWSDRAGGRACRQRLFRQLGWRRSCELFPAADAVTETVARRARPDTLGRH